MSEEEIWKDIPGYEGRYQASSLGRIRSLDRISQGRNRFTGKPFDRHLKGRVLRPGRYSKAGHVSVALGCKTAGKPVHELVARTFLGERPSGADVCHNNGDPTDNRVENLRYDTRRENILDTYRLPGGRWRKLSAQDVMEIRTRLAAGERGVDLSREYQISQPVISSIKVGRIYGWLNEDFIRGY